MLKKLADLLEANAQRLGTVESTDNGKIIRETSSQMVFAARAYRFFAGAADKILAIRYRSTSRTCSILRAKNAGVAVLITAWNSPLSLLANKLAPLWLPAIAW